MAVAFDDVLLDTAYSSDAVGGSEFSTVAIGSGEGGNITYFAEAREDYISKYEIEFAQLIPERRKALRKFAILRKGMARGFRFLAPDDQTIDSETVGVLNTATGEIEKLTSTNGTTSKFFIIKNYLDAFNSYLRWITHPSPLDTLTIKIFNTSDLFTPLAQATFAAGATSAGALPEGRQVTLPGYGLVTLSYRYGVLIFATAPPSGKVIQVTSGVYHHPVHFGADWLKFSVDDGDWSNFKVQLEELLPISFGLYPAMTIPGITLPPDVTAPTVPGSFLLTGTSASAMSATWSASTDTESGVDHYILELSFPT